MRELPAPIEPSRPAAHVPRSWAFGVTWTRQFPTAEALELALRDRGAGAAFRFSYASISDLTLWRD